MTLQDRQVGAMYGERKKEMNKRLLILTDGQGKDGTLKDPPFHHQS